MRLRDILDRLKWASDLEVRDKVVGGVHPAAFRLVNRDAVNVALLHLREVAPLASSAQSLLNDAWMNGPSVGDPERTSFANRLAAFKKHATDLEQMLHQVLKEQDAESFAIRLPDPETVEDLRQTLGDLKLVFEAPVKLYFEGDVPPLRFQGFDVGTSWLEVFGYSALPLKFVFAILTAANKYRHGAAKARKDEAEAQAAELAVEMLKSFAEYQEQLLKHQLDQATKGIVEGFSEHRRTENVTEASNAVRAAIVLWAGLLERGATVRPALNAPSAIREVFPDTADDPAQLEEKITKLLTAGTKDEGEE